MGAHAIALVGVRRVQEVHLPSQRESSQLQELQGRALGPLKIDVNGSSATMNDILDFYYNGNVWKKGEGDASQMSLEARRLPEYLRVAFALGAHELHTRICGPSLRPSRVYGNLAGEEAVRGKFGCFLHSLNVFAEPTAGVTADFRELVIACVARTTRVSCGDADLASLSVHAVRALVASLVGADAKIRLVNLALMW